jgi:hypothetical protein
LVQTSISPTSAIIDQNGVGSLFITNPGESAQEISVSFLFGYPGYKESEKLNQDASEDSRMENSNLKT